MHIPGIDHNDYAVLALSFTTITVAQMNLVVAAFTGVAGLCIQLYFKMQQNRREQEEHDWKRKKNP